MSAIAFELSNLRRHDGKTIRAFFDVTLPGVVIRDCRLHIRRGVALISGPGMRTTFAVGGWRDHAELDADLAHEILEAVGARLSADESGDA